MSDGGAHHGRGAVGGRIECPIIPLEKGLFPVAFIVCLLGQVLLMRSAEYLSKGQDL